MATPRRLCRTRLQVTPRPFGGQGAAHVSNQVVTDNHEDGCVWEALRRYGLGISKGSLPSMGYARQSIHLDLTVLSANRRSFDRIASLA